MNQLVNKIVNKAPHYFPKPKVMYSVLILSDQQSTIQNYLHFCDISQRYRC